MGVLEFVSLMAIYLEIAVLALFEYKMWRTMYTPLNLLMLPYAAVLFFTILFSGHWGIVDFYYPSIMVWMIGLLIFAVPSFVLGIKYNYSVVRRFGHEGFVINDSFGMRSLNILTTFLVAIFFLRFLLLLRSSSFLVGSEDFGEEYCGFGIWGHLHRAFHALVMIYLYKLDRKHWYYLLLIMGMLFVTFIYGVRSWILIPLAGGICMRLITGKLKLKLSLILKITFVGFLIFFLTYFMALFFGKGDNAANVAVIFEYIIKAFIHYFVSGVLGWSQDLQMGILETPYYDSLIVNVVNLVNLFTGDEFINAINPHFIHNGIKLSNVRAFFGTIYINATIIQFVLTVLVVSALHYLALLWSVRSRNFFVYLICFFWSGMLMMGWFEIYFYHLQFLEVPMWVLIIYLFIKCTSDSTACKKV